MSVKKTHKTDTARHPFSKKKLCVLDSFVPKEMACPVCNSQTVDKVLVVQADTPGQANYHVVSCTTCNRQNWFVFSR